MAQRRTARLTSRHCGESTGSPHRYADCGTPGDGAHHRIFSQRPSPAKDRAANSRAAVQPCIRPRVRVRLGGSTQVERGPERPTGGSAKRLGEQRGRVRQGFAPTHPTSIRLRLLAPRSPSGRSWVVDGRGRGEVLGRLLLAGHPGIPPTPGRRRRGTPISQSRPHTPQAEPPIGGVAAPREASCRGGPWAGQRSPDLMRRA